jgi:hypothetical protein
VSFGGGICIVTHGTTIATGIATIPAVFTLVAGECAISFVIGMFFVGIKPGHFNPGEERCGPAINMNVCIMMAKVIACQGLIG